jgi:molecular chaperone GrpE
MGGNRVDLKKEQTARSQDSTNNQQEDQEELAADMESPTQAEEDEVDKEEDFDPDTADRDALLAKYRELEDQLAEAEDRVLRAAADAENFKKRLQREKEEQSRYATEAIMRDLLAVIDNLERALDHSQAGSNQGGLVEGLNITVKGFLDTLARFGCTPVEAMGEIFDPKFHEAISQEESADHEANTVIRELQKGYMLKERLLRPAMVVVSKPPSQEGGINQEKAEDGSEKAESDKVKIRVKKV